MTTKLVPRSITFTIPASSSGDPSVTVNAQEDPSGNGRLDFTATVNTTPSGVIGDLGGLFFDYNDTKLSGLKASGSSVTTYQTGDDNVINIAPGINMDGAVGTPYDVGIAFGTAGIGANRQDIQKASFVLSDPANNLTLDDLHQSGETSQFGARVTSIGTPTSSRSGSDKDTSTGTSIPYAPTASNDSETAPPMARA
jgi:hypothetical protein